LRFLAAPVAIESVPWDNAQGYWQSFDGIAIDPIRSRFFVAWGGDQRFLTPGDARFVLDGSNVWGVIMAASRGV
jgi:hypothetical protein